MAAKKRKERAPLPASESPGERFTRLATARVNAAIKKISLISNLAGSGYASTPEQQEKIIAVLNHAVAVVKDCFNKTKPEAEKFTL